MLRVEGLRRSAGGFRLRVDQWEVPAGTYLVLVGPSGAGKTMLLETIAGLERPAKGRIWIGDRLATDLPAEARGIGFVYQDCWLFPHLTARQNIDFARRYHRGKGREDGPAADELAEMLGIGELLDRKPGTLSGGERQRVALARALSTRPRMMFLDEPLGMLDPVTREAVAAEIHKCHRRFGTTTVHVTHDHAEARSMGDQVAVMLDGVLEQSGPTEQVFRMPRSRALARFLGCENVFECRSAPSDVSGHVRIDVGGRTLVVPSTLTGLVAACVRPEEVLIEPAGETASRAASTASYPGVVAELSHRGPLVRLVVESQGTRWVSLAGRSRHDSDRHHIGEQVTVVIRTENIHLMPAEA